ncbi:hypothetical protein X751_31350 [Mesorhizobium sp. LNJC395A00]|nr:hypothetical protein X751_31350 [Mesorhizobium sp. LNJC395A00]
MDEYVWQPERDHFRARPLVWQTHKGERYAVSYKQRYRFLPQIIAHPVWPSFRSP